MKEDKNWIVIDLKTKNALYGFGGITMRFSSKEVAEEIASLLFEYSSEYLVFYIKLAGLK